jgi:pimeloyl-ACP methyl ester carboxylesterase
VVLESGLNDPAAPWFAVERAVGAFTRVCSYDRANALGGASDPAPTPRTAGGAVADLHALLAVANVPGPYVLVGHSFGGIVSRLYAATHADEVAGLVLVDPSHEDQDARLQALVGPELWEAYQMGGGMFNPEGIDMAASFAQVRAARATAPLQPIPLVVVTAGDRDAPAVLPSFAPPGWPVEAVDRLWRELQADLARLVPNGQHVIAQQSGHYVHQTEPTVVVEAIRQVVTSVR